MDGVYKSSQRKSDTSSLTASSAEPSHTAMSKLQGRITALNREIQTIDEYIAELQRDRADLVSEKLDAEKKLSAAGSETNASGGPTKTSGHDRPTPESGPPIDYTQEFEWTASMKMRMNKIFNIKSFRLCQEGVCNACMDGRDVVCVMPTGGGKSLTYQLPAVMSRGCTLVISPLISLITDQILHLREAGVEAVMLTSALSKEDSRALFVRLNAAARSDAAASECEIKLLYVTPEKISQSKTLLGSLQKLSAAGKLARIVIDEAHCVSQLGHDFRPDYKKLYALRQLFPYVPILALSATCPPKVLRDLLKVLRLNPVVDGNVANRTGTVYFSAPLYRKNLHYKTVPKPSNGVAVIQLMVQYILRHHPKDSGIVYCFSKKDTETVAQGLIDLSGGQIRVGVYHSDVKDAQKERLHVRWRSGEIKVVCATIAFGLGIDKADVRFVLHHSISKSLDGFYQETGRAGRDGNDADCVLYYRVQDASRLSSLTYAELEGQQKLHAMVRFAQDLTECRKVQFAQYFSTSSSLSLSAWSDADGGSLAKCGHCDNCTRSPDSIITRDVTFECWQILKILESLTRDDVHVTISILADLVRGVKPSGGGGKGVTLDLDGLIGGKVTLNRGDTEALVVHLLLLKYLKEDFRSTAYSVNVYIVLGAQASHLLHVLRFRIEAGEGSRIFITLPSGKKSESKSLGTAKDSNMAKSRGKEDVRHDDNGDADEESSGDVSGSDSTDEKGEMDDGPQPGTSSVPRSGATPPSLKFAVYLPRAPASKRTDNTPTTLASAPARRSPTSFFVSSGDEADNSRAPLPTSANVAGLTSGPDGTGDHNSSDSNVMLDEEGWSFSLSNTSAGGSTRTKRTSSMSQSTGGSGSSSKKKPRVSFDTSVTTAGAKVDIMDLSSD